MDAARKAVRTRLKAATMAEYNAMVADAKLTPMQVLVLTHHILNDKTLLETADELNCCERTVAGMLQKAYEKIKKVGLKVQA